MEASKENVEESLDMTTEALFKIASIILNSNLSNAETSLKQISSITLDTLKEVREKLYPTY